MESSTSDNNVKIISFCVPLPSSSSLLAAAEDAVAAPSGFGIVGTITFRGQSAVVWFGWGAIEEAVEGSNVSKGIDGIVSVGNGKPPMGSLALSMPPVVRNGRPRIDGVPTTHLLGGSSEEDMILGHQISARLAKRVGWPIFVSCSFGGWGGDSGGNAAGGGQDGTSNVMASGYDDTMQQHAAALAEREVSRILLQHREKVS